MAAYRLLSVNADAKTVKGQKLGVLTGILYLSPADESGLANVCPFASPGCKASCLYTAGRAGIFPKINQARLRRTALFVSDRRAFYADVIHDIETLERHAARLGMRPAVRLNGTSDIAHELLFPELFLVFPEIQFYDYTKVNARMSRFLRGDFPENYHLTFSRSESNWLDVDSTLHRGGNVAMVFEKTLPATWAGYPVLNGDLSDVRYADLGGHVIGLKAKGRAKKDQTGFVIRESRMENAS